MAYYSLQYRTAGNLDEILIFTKKHFYSLRSSLAIPKKNNLRQVLGTVPCVPAMCMCPFTPLLHVNKWLDWNQLCVNGA